MKRRDLLKNTGLFGISALLAPALSAKGLSVKTPNEKLKIIVSGGHPDDPETGCGGTIKLLTNAGHQVINYYLTVGQGGIEGLSAQKAAEIRKKEAVEACRILGAQRVFGSQLDGAAEVNKARYDEILQFLEEQKPDVVFTQWPIDTHPDHRACSLLFYNAWLRSSSGFDLYYYEVMTGRQTQNFTPTVFVDISSVIESKRKACFAHKSQKVKEWYDNIHGVMEKFRGGQCYARYGEAFARQQPFGSNLFS